MAEIVPSVKIVERREISGILGNVNEEKDKIANSSHLLPSKRIQKREGDGGDAVS